MSGNIEIRGRRGTEVAGVIGVLLLLSTLLIIAVALLRFVDTVIIALMGTSHDTRLSLDVMWLLCALVVAAAWIILELRRIRIAVMDRG
jgi:hypothetical protein